MRTSRVRQLGWGLLLAVAVGLPGAYLISGCQVDASVTVSASGAISGSVTEDASFSFPGIPTSVACDGGTPLQPTFGPTCTASAPPPPISGGTVLVTKDGRTAVVCDPDRDAVYIVDLATLKVAFTVALQSGDEPGRLVEDGAGRVHVALRGGGALATIDPSTGTVVERRPVCPAPRGVVWDTSRDVVWVACATGEVVALPSAGGTATTAWVVERDLRDILLVDGALTLSEFRSAQTLQLASDGSIASRATLPVPDGGFLPHVAWRTVLGANDTIAIVYQEHSQQSITTKTTGAYGSSGCGPASGAVGSVLTVLGGDGSVQVNRTFDGVLPVDVAVSGDGSTLAVAAPGSSFTQSAAFLLRQGGRGEQTPLAFPDFTQVPIAVAFDGSGDVLVQTREPATLWVFKSTLLDGGTAPAPVAIPLSLVTRCDSGHDIFHVRAGAPIACASCHPEGGDDGHVWLLDGQPRRTPSLRGTVAGTAPYHWSGDEADLPTLVNDVYTVRMSGQSLAADDMVALTSWVQALPPPPSPSWLDPARVARGKALFDRTDTGCSGCHSGAKLTNDATLDVGTGGAFQVPPLVGVGWRTPLLHDGCARTIADRFTTCATTGHGTTSALSATDLGDLGAYLDSL